MVCFLCSRKELYWFYKCTSSFSFTCTSNSDRTPCFFKSFILMLLLNRFMRRNLWGSRTLVFGCVTTLAVELITCTGSTVIWRWLVQSLPAVSIKFDVVFKLDNLYYYMAGSASGQDEANPVFCLATREGKKGLSWPLGITCFGPANKNCLKPAYIQ